LRIRYTGGCEEPATSTPEPANDGAHRHHRRAPRYRQPRRLGRLLPDVPAAELRERANRRTEPAGDPHSQSGDGRAHLLCAGDRHGVVQRHLARPQ
jgi:hypothetical protein